MAADTYHMATTDNGDVIRFVTNNGKAAARREWSGWKAGLPGTSKPDPDKHGPGGANSEPPSRPAA